NMRVLVTGGAGFIGSAIARAYLARGASVTIVDNLATGRREWVPEGAQFHRLDIGDPALERVFGEEGSFDVVSHHAALKDVRKAMIDPRPDAEANILGTLNVLRCAADHDAGRFVFASSAAIYGDAALPTSEDAPMAPISPYGISKAACERYAAYFAHNRGLPAVALRYSCVYGPAAAEESEAGVITIFARRMLQGRRPVMYGNGEQTRDFVFVDDVVRANLVAADAAPRPWAAYNVSSGIETSLNSLYAALGREAGYAELPERADRRPGEILRNVQDASLIRRELGWTPEVELRTGLARVVEAYRAELLVAAAR
ncbi:MAG TPA: NAD-dependent epimerase/dehydratase family protein, partial [Chloroflexota bacterium]|nr:NAD-dependent epimerase/dehydratase family protein [Chloroflexota bacterium]